MGYRSIISLLLVMFITTACGSNDRQAQQAQQAYYAANPYAMAAPADQQYRQAYDPQNPQMRQGYDPTNPQNRQERQPYDAANPQNRQPRPAYDAANPYAMDEAADPQQMRRSNNILMGAYTDRTNPQRGPTDFGEWASPRPLMMRNLPGGDDSYSTGFQDGCSTTINFGEGLVRTHPFAYNIDRGLKDKNYYAGYRAGTVYCVYFADVDPL